jgi:hypothetical protein
VTWAIRPSVVGQSAEALQLGPARTDYPERGREVVGLCVHTTGEDDKITAAIRAANVDAGKWYAQFYRTAQYYPHYVGGWDGRLWLIADEHRHVPHVGCKDYQREQYLSGRWETEWKTYEGNGAASPANLKVVARWHVAWPMFESPQHLFPGPSPNDVYVGLELPPVIDGMATPAAPGLKFTHAQHELVARLAVDLNARWGVNGWRFGTATATPRLLGHEDLAPMDRPGWDPGALRAAPEFDWALVRDLINARSTE